MTDTLTLKGTISCPVYEYVEWPPGSGKGHSFERRRDVIPVTLKVTCKGEGEARRCTVKVPECPERRHVSDPPATVAEYFTARGLKPPDGLVRRQDNSGKWNTSVEWVGDKYQWDQDNKQKVETFSLQVWDDDESETPTVYPHLNVFLRPYARADKRMEGKGWHIETTKAELKKVAAVLRAAAGKWVYRGENLRPDELAAAPPIRVGGEVIDWPRARQPPGAFSGIGLGRSMR